MNASCRPDGQCESIFLNMSGCQAGVSIPVEMYCFGADLFKKANIWNETTDPLKLLLELISNATVLWSLSVP